MLRDCGVSWVSSLLYLIESVHGEQWKNVTFVTSIAAMSGILVSYIIKEITCGIVKTSISDTKIP